MKPLLTERQELQLRKNASQWHRRQATIGNVFLLLCVASIISFVVFVMDPGRGTAWLLFISLVLMAVSGFSMAGSAYAVVRHKQLLQFPDGSTSASEAGGLPAAAFDVIDAEVIGPSFEQAAG